MCTWVWPGIRFLPRTFRVGLGLVDVMLPHVPFLQGSMYFATNRGPTICERINYVFALLDPCGDHSSLEVCGGARKSVGWTMEDMLRTLNSLIQLACAAEQFVFPQEHLRIFHMWVRREERIEIERCGYDACASADLCKYWFQRRR